MTSKIFNKSLPFAQNMGIIWLGLVLSVILAIAFLLPIQPNDYWWYVRLGQDIVAEGGVPTVDTFTYTQTGQPIVYHSWLAALLFWLIHQMGDAPLTIFVRGVLLAIFYSLTWYSCRLLGAGPRLAAILTFLAALTGSNNWAMRPQLFSYPLFGLSLVCVLRWQIQKTRLVWLLPLIVLLWVNLHGAFILCFLLVGAALVGGGGDRRQLASVLGVMVLTVLVNPRGLGAWTYVISLLTDPASQQLGAEWQTPTTNPWQGKLFFSWLLFFPLFVTIAKNKLSATQWLWFLGFGWMAVSGLRYVIWFLTILAPLTAFALHTQVNPFTDRKQLRGIPLLNLLFFLFLILVSSPLLPGVRQQWWSEDIPVLTANTPVKATTWLAEQPDLPGPLWSDLAFASYLIYALPDRPVWLDTRFELFPLTQWEDYVTISEGAPNWDDLLQSEGINLIMLDREVQSRLLTALITAKDWCLSYEDDRTVIFSRCKIETE